MNSYRVYLGSNYFEDNVLHECADITEALTWIDGNSYRAKTYGPGYMVVVKRSQRKK